ncbi:MAG: glycosyltransferase, partial [Bacteroidota bacterium]
ALIIPPDSAPLEKHGRTVLPFKTFLYLAAGRPVVAPRQPDMEEVLVHEYNSLLVEPNNFADCARAIERLLNDPALHLKICENAAASVKELTWEERARKIIGWLTEVYFKKSEGGQRQAEWKHPHVSDTSKVSDT